MSNPWTAHLAKFRATHPSLNLKECMQAASKTYSKQGVSYRSMRGPNAMPWTSDNPKKKQYINALRKVVRRFAMVVHNTEDGAKFTVKLEGKHTLKGEVGILFNERGDMVTPWWKVGYIQMCNASYPGEYCGDFDEVPHYHKTLEDFVNDVGRTMELLSTAQKTKYGYKITI